MPSSIPDPMPRGLALARRDALLEIEARDEQHEQVLLTALVRAAWPTLRAQNQ